MDAFQIYFAGAFLVLFGLCLYRAILSGPPAAEAYGVWLPAVLLAVVGMGLVWTLGWLILGPVRAQALLALAVYFVRRDPGRPPSGGDFAYLFTLCASVLFVPLLRLLGRAAQKRSDGAIAQEIERWRQENEPPR